MRLDFPEAPAHERPRGEPAASVKITFYLCAGGLPRDPRLRTFKLHAAGFFSQESGILGIRKSRPRLRPARLSGSARGGFPAAGAVSGTLRREIPFRAFQELEHRCGANAPGERESGPVFKSFNTNQGRRNLPGAVFPREYFNPWMISGRIRQHPGRG